MEYLIIAAIVIGLFSGIFAPNKNSTSYRLGRGMGSKTRKLGKWLMDEWAMPNWHVAKVCANMAEEFPDVFPYMDNESDIYDELPTEDVPYERN